MTDASPQGDSVASTASARVGEILAEAEKDGTALREAAERDAAGTEGAARKMAEQFLADARDSARAAGRERADALLALRAAIAGRGPALVEGLEGAGPTKRRLEALIEALDAAAERVLAEADAPLEEGRSEPAEPETAQEPQTAQEDQDEPSGSAGGNSSNGADGATAYDGPLPEGAPMVRKPRTRQSDVRFAAVLLAVQGQEREEVEHHLRNEYGAADCEPILDEVFGQPV